MISHHFFTRWIMEGGGSVHGKFLHILVLEFVSWKEILSQLLCFASFRFLEEYKIR